MNPRKYARAADGNPHRVPYHTSIRNHDSSALNMLWVALNVLGAVMHPWVMSLIFIIFQEEHASLQVNAVLQVGAYLFITMMNIITLIYTPLNRTNKAKVVALFLAVQMAWIVISVALNALIYTAMR